MARLAAGCVTVLLALLLAATAAARDPRLERIALTPADQALAQRIAVKAGDLGGSWQRVNVPRSDDERMTCPGFNPDFSRFTITGRSITGFATTSGASVMSAVEVYRSAADAIGDFNTGAKPVVARCLKAELSRQLSATPGLSFSIPVAKVVPAPRVGDRRIAFRIVAKITAGLQSLSLQMDVVAFQRGRSIVALYFTHPARGFPGQSRVAAAVAARMR